MENDAPKQQEPEPMEQDGHSRSRTPQDEPMQSEEEQAELNAERKARAERNQQLRIRRGQIFEEKMERFRVYSALSKLQPTDCHWPLVSRSPQKRKLCGYVYGYRYPPEQHVHDNNQPIANFNSNRFLEIISAHLYAAGAGPTPVAEINLFVFERTMKIIVEYCNFMYDSALQKNKELITSEEIEELVGRCKLRQYLYYRHFYPTLYPYEAQQEFKNRFSRRIHEAFHTNEDTRHVYYSEEIFNILQQRTNPIIKMHFENYPLANTGLDQNMYVQTFVADPTGRLSMFAANRFHEALGLPPLETDLITVLAWLAKLVVNEIVFRALTLWQDTLGLTGQPLLHCYQASMRNDKLLTGTDDILFNLEFTIFHSALPDEHPPFDDDSPPDSPDAQDYYIQEQIMIDVEKYRDSFYDRHCRSGCAQEMYRRNRDIMCVNESRKR